MKNTIIKYFKENKKALDVLDYLVDYRDILDTRPYNDVLRATKTSDEELDDIIYHFEEFTIVEINEYNMLEEGGALMYWYGVHKCNAWDDKQLLNKLDNIYHNEDKLYQLIGEYNFKGE